MSLLKGSIVVDELIIPITDVYLAAGKIVVVGELAGPVPGRQAAGYTVHGRDGVVVFRSEGHIGGLTWDDVRAPHRLALVAPIEVIDKTVTAPALGRKR